MSKSAAARRKAAYDEAIAEARGHLDEIRALRSDDPRTDATSDVAKLVAAEFERQRRANVEAAQAAERERRRHPSGGGCSACGIGYSNTDHEDPWTSLDGRLLDVFCWNRHVIYDRFTDTPADHKVRVIAHLLGLDGLPLLAAANPYAFDHIRVWFHEFPDATPDPERRWAHLDLADLRRSWDAVITGPEIPEPEIRSGDPCPECGCVEWSGHLMGELTYVDTEGKQRTESGVVAPSRCVDCSIQHLATATGSVPAWWARRRCRKLPKWARPFVEHVPA